MRTKINSVAELQKGRQYVVVIGTTELAVAWERDYPYVESICTGVETLLGLGCPIFDVTPEPEPEVLLEWEDEEGDLNRLLSNGDLGWLPTGSVWRVGCADTATPIAQEIIRLRQRVKELEK